MDREQLKAMITEEKNAFIQAEYGRLQAIMGEEYTTDSGEIRIFHPLPEPSAEGERVLGNPKELTLTELAQLPWLYKKINRFGAVTDMPIMFVHPKDKERLPLLERISQALITGMSIPEKDEAEFTGGHGAYLAFKKEELDEPVVIKGI